MSHKKAQKVFLTFFVLFCGCWSVQAQSVVYDVRAFGAKGDGRTLDTPAINKAIEAAAAAVDATLLGKIRQLVAKCEWCQARTAIEYRVTRGRPALQRFQCGRCGQAVEFYVSGEVNASRTLPDS